MAELPIFFAIASALFSAVGAISQAGQQASAEKHNAKAAERNAQIARQQAAADAEAQQRDARKRIGAQRAAIGASGVGIEGSPLDALEESAANAELDRQNILYRGRLREIGYQDESSQALYNAGQAKSSGYMRAGSALLGGAAKAFSMSPSASP